MHPSEHRAPAIRRRAGMSRSVPITSSDSTENRLTRRFRFAPDGAGYCQRARTRSRAAPRSTCRLSHVALLALLGIPSAALRLRFERIFGPVVFRIAAAHVLADFSVGTAPKTRQVARDLHRPLRGRKELKRDCGAAAANPWRGVEPENLLQAHRHGRRT